MPELTEIVAIEITKPLPGTGVIDTTYKIEGTAKMFEKVGAPPWVYARVRRKEWFKPEIAEEVSYERGFPNPVTGEFSIDFKPKKEGDYEVTLVATPAPLSLPVVGVPPITGESDVMKLAIEAAPPAEFRFSGVKIDGHDVPLTDHDADSGLLLAKTTADYLDIIPAFEWAGPETTATISIKAGYKSALMGFEPKTDAYTKQVTLPESPFEPYQGELDSPIRIPLTACGGLTNGAIEVVLKIAGEPDYISHIWNVYVTGIEKKFRFSAVIIDGHDVPLTDHDADSGLLLEKTTADHLDINPAFEWQGPEQPAVISIKAGYKSALLGFEPKTKAYTKEITLPAVPFEPSNLQLETPIRIPLTECGRLSDGAIEVVLKITGEPDYISHIWNVYATELEILEVDITPSGSGYVTTNPPPAVGENRFTDGSTGEFTYGTEVQVTAHPNPGYQFDHWSDEIRGGTSINNPEWLSGPMTEHRAVKAHFREAELGFDLTRPSVSKTSVVPGTVIDITCPVTSRCEIPVDARAKIIIYEGTLMIGHGAKLKEYDSDVFHIEPDQSKDIVVHHTAIAGTIDRRDIEVEISVAEKLIKESEWDDVYYVRTMETLEVDITPSGSGYVTTTPPPAVGSNYFVDGSTRQFTYGTEVQVTAHPNPDYQFDHWSDEIRGGVSYGNPEWLSGPMTEHRAVKAHFILKEVPPVVEEEYRNLRVASYTSPVRIGGYCYVGISFDYKGPPVTREFYAAIGNEWIVFNEVVAGRGFRSIGAASTWQSRTVSVAIPITPAVDPKDSPYDLYAKIVDPQLVSPTVFDVVTVQPTGEYTLTVRASPDVGYVEIYPYKSSYSHGEKVTLIAVSPFPEYRFSHWGGDASGVNATLPITMDRNKSIIAYYVSA